MASKKIQLYTDRDKTIEASPETSANCVILSDGNDLQKVLDNDLTNPTAVHEETSFKVGVGDIDVSSSVVDGEVGRMVIKGKTYQNILPEPSTHVLTNNKEMFKVNEGLDPNVEIVDAVSKSAILKGQTLVNVLSGEKKDLSNNEGGNGLIDFLVNQNLKANAVYTAIFKVETNAELLRVGITATSSSWNSSSAAYVNGNNKILLTTTTETAYSLRFRYNDTSLKSLVVSNVMLIEGDYTDVDIPYFEGMQSVKMPVLKTTGKNTIYQVKYETLAEDIQPDSLSNVGYGVLDNSDSWTLSFPSSQWIRAYGYDSNGNYTENFAQFTPHQNKKFNIKPSNNLTKIIKFRFWTDEEPQLEKGTQATPYEPFKSNILTVNDDITLRKVGNVEDTLDLVTGEYVQRIGEVVLDGSQSGVYRNGDMASYYQIQVENIYNGNGNSSGIISDKLNSYMGHTVHSTAVYGIGAETGGIKIRLSECSSEDDYKNYLSTTPITVQYWLATESVKTVDLSSSGNWEKIVLNGSENWQSSDTSKDKTHRFILSSLTNRQHGVENLICDKVVVKNTYNTDEEGILGSAGGAQIYLRILKSKLVTQDVNGLKQYLQQNPITVWYQTVTHQDSTQVKQPIFFKDGHIIQSSGADNSLIPTLDYQAKTSNSYVMDLMKANTRYTMKAKSASGNFTLGGSSYSLGTNRVFSTTGAEFNANNMMVITGSYEDLMILEGELTSKTIPYFKGIKSAFEDESKIEVLSTSQNILDTSKIVQGDLLNSGIIGATGGSADLYCYTEEFIPCPNIKHPLYVHRTIDGVYSSSTYYIFFFDEDKRLLQPRNVSNTFTIPDGAKYLRIMVHKGNVDVSRVGIMVTNSGADRFNQSVGGLQNSTKIPLLSPLRSLPNGVCDELIIDRMKKKATLVQRVGVGFLDGTQGISTNISNVDTNLYQPFFCGDVFGNMAIVPHNVVTIRCDKLLACSSSTTYRSLTTNAIYQYTDSSARLAGQITKKDLGVKSVRDWFRANPTTIYYQLATPVITEVDLEGFPYIYKDGHIFLNSEIAPVVEIDYNVNQAQQIQANNETLQRHELDILDLDNLIVSFVNAEYNLRLLKFDMELSMMALAE